ncbi:MAG: YceD family protein [Polaromonas sp.]
MTRPTQVSRMNMQAFAEAGVPLNEVTPLQNLERLAHESVGLEPDSIVNWQATPELRAGSTGQMDIWLHLQANTSVPLTCQRCMGVVQTDLQVDQWYRFVATEDIAMAEDDASDEDLLVLTPQFDLAEVLEDELLMALPLVPMHDACPVMPAFSAGLIDEPGDQAEKPNPFAALAQLKKK